MVIKANLENKLECILENKRIVSFGEPGANIGIHRVNICLINSHRFPSKTRRVIDWDVMKIRMFLPILVQNEQQFLSSSKCELGKQDMTTATDDGMYQSSELMLLLRSANQTLNAISAFYN